MSEYHSWIHTILQVRGDSGVCFMETLSLDKFTERERIESEDPLPSRECLRSMRKEVKTGGTCDENCFGVLVVIDQDLEGCSYIGDFLSLIDKYPFPIPDSTHESREISRIQEIIVR